MANVGDQLLQPEAGWRRYDDVSDEIFYGGQWHTETNTMNYYGGTSKLNKGNVYVSFSFYGSDLRIIGARHRFSNSSATITIDSSQNSFSIYNANSSIFQCLMFEVTGLEEKVHDVKISYTSGAEMFYFDAIDIDETGYLTSFKKIPATKGSLCDKLDEMAVGDYIVWKRDGAIHSFGGNIDGFIELPTTGVEFAYLPSKHFHYAIKVDTGLLISDRVTEHSISWDTLNSQKKIQGLPVTINGVSGVIRSLTGGVAYADENGNRSMTNLNKGCFPTNNEWDKYFINFPKSKIQSGKSLDDVWHHMDIYTLTQDTASNGIYVSSGGTNSATVNSTFRTMRGKSGIWGDLGIRQSSNSGTDAGFRPVFEWREI